ncbi:MAG: adenylate/guanylate cyclase domain-containing protein [Desulfobacterales bacterium]|nr:adenylate/guanylate cyclase domain-containing protein [Pseudomonadota bacterium]MBU4353894.1 adenylate/guanylate cyclase domain-containing protein [Pseudomonadota bacterium]MCG2772601.1 adenylate/guanylate cyclase domain-containing protein [Desulfobacterales bacterium]
MKRNLGLTAAFRHAKWLAALGLTLAALVLSLVLDLSGAIQPYRLKTLDVLFRRVPLPAASPQVVVVTVDQPDLDFFKTQGITWPWPREVYAPLIEYCRWAGAKAVIFDILFTEASSYGSKDDQKFARAVAAAGNVALPFFLSRDVKPPNPSEADLLKQAGLTIPGPAPQDQPAYRSVVTPIPALLAAAAALGNVESSPDADGIYRRVRLVAPFKDKWLPALGFAAFHRFGAPGDLRFTPGALKVGDLAIPLDGQGQFLLKFRGPSRSHKRFSAANIIASEARRQHGQPPIYPPADFAGKWVLVGLTAPGLLDLKASPVAAVYPGVEVHATLLDNLLRGDFLRPAPLWGLWAGIIVLSAAMVLVVLFFSGLAATLTGFAALALAYLGLVVGAFHYGWWADPVLPGVALGFSFTLAAAFSYATEGRQKLYIRRMFGQYMSETVINHLLEHPEKLQLGGERRRVTLFFSDLAGFTTISERLSAETVVSLLNDYLSCMTEIILDEAGTVDKFEGDAIMAFWGAPLDQPDQAPRACRAALRQQAALQELNRGFAGLNLPPLSMRIGLHTGDAIVGNLGSAKRFDYTVIGDTVNLASRLEGVNKFYGSHIMASETTVAECTGTVEFRELDLVAVKGKEQAVRVFEVLGLTGELEPELIRRRQDFAQALELYRQRCFPEAGAAFEAILTENPEDGPARVYRDRCRRLQEAPPPADWDTVFRPEGK